MCAGDLPYRRNFPATTRIYACQALKCIILPAIVFLTRRGGYEKRLLGLVRSLMSEHAQTMRVGQHVEVRFKPDADGEGDSWHSGTVTKCDNER